jgi:pilus assembly protein HofM
MAVFAGLTRDAGLLHRLDQEWLWVAPRSMPFAYGVLPVGEIGSAQQALAAMRMACSALDDQPVYYSSVLDEPVPAGCTSWSPFTAFSHLQPPLPQQPMAFVLACGLALRREDR